MWWLYKPCLFLGRLIQRVGPNGYPDGDPTDVRFSGDITGRLNGYN